jgi:3-phosphoshikimate 1-carboxyvinyltransferase
VPKLISHPAKPLQGTTLVPGDKSISHRALILGAMTVGRSEVSGLLEGEDVLHTAGAMRSLGALVEKQKDGNWTIDGVGVGGFSEPSGVIDMGNSGTAVRLLMGAVATHNFTTFFTGDASLCRRPMARVTVPLKKCGALFVGREGGRLPLAVTGSPAPLPITFELPVASAQVKSAILLAGLNCPGTTTVIEPEPTRDHTERMLCHFGAEVTVTPRPLGGNEITLKGYPELRPARLDVPGDPSSAAFPVVAALITPGSSVTIRNVGINPLRIGLYDTLREMGADITFTNERIACGEPVADIAVKASKLKGVKVPAARAPSMIDEYPILCIAAAFAEGKTVMNGLAELRVKESDRLAAMARGLQACGVTVGEKADGLTVTGGARFQTPAAPIITDMDHRIAMSFLVLGMAAGVPVAVDDGSMIDTSFPNFSGLMNGLGGQIESADTQSGGKV